MSELTLVGEEHVPSKPKMIDRKVLSWASIIDDNTIEQATVLSRMPFIPHHVALMADAHLGKGATIGSVIPTVGAIIPAAVGVDLGCGMAATKLDITAAMLPDNLDDLLTRIEESIPSGVGQGHSNNDMFGAVLRIAERTPPSTEITKSEKLFQTTCEQLATLGSGNHFFEVSVDPEDNVWLVVHSGSRGIGNQLARKHIDVAKGLMKNYFITLADPDLSYLVQGTPEFEAYIADLRFAQAYAFENRQIMMKRALRSFAAFLQRPLKSVFDVNCHHNYTSIEHHMGKNMWITRKGAISAREGEFGILPGSMGTETFIVRGLGDPASFTSAPHGAGRLMSRTRANKELSAESLTEMMEGKTWLAGKADKLVDEHPRAYKPIEVVLRDSASLVEVVTRLSQILNYKGL